MEFHGVFGRFIKRNEKTGESVFSVLFDGDTRYSVCTGITPLYDKCMPLLVDAVPHNGQYNVTHIHASGFSDDTTIKYLAKTDTLRNIGMLNAYNIVMVTGYDIFGYLTEHFDTFKDKPPEIKGISEENVIKIFTCIHNLSAFEKLYDQILSYGGNYSNASELFAKYGSGASSAVIANPYSLLYSGTALTICETLAKKQGFTDYNPKRMKAITEYAMAFITKNGNTRAKFEDLCDLIWYFEKHNGDIYHSDPIFIAQEIITSDTYYIEETDNEVYIYFMSYYRAEKDIADNIHRLISSSSPLFSGIDVTEIGKACGIAYSPDQAQCFHVLDDSGVKIITGGPGTGKTTILKGLLYAYKKRFPQKKYRLCAPTGCAARRMSDCTGEIAETIHRMLRIRPYEKDLCARTSDKLDADLLIIDEGSMIDTMIMARLLASAKNDALVIILGDKDQLPSVGAGNVFADLIKSHTIPVYCLKSIFRQDARSLIVANSKKVINGICGLDTGRNFKICRVHNENELIASAEKIAGQCYEHNIGFKLYTPSRNRKFKTGTIQMNSTLRNIKKHPSAETISYGAYEYSVGDSILFNVNNYEKGYYNGQEGVICDIQNHGCGPILSIQSDNVRISLSGKELNDIELAYAITAHKSQGGECQNALILIPKEPHSMLKKQLLYVEITRARRNVIILTEGNALEQTLSYKGNIVRETGLLGKL